MDELTVRYLQEEDKKQICRWKYEGQYAVYDLPPYEEMRSGKLGFANPSREQNYLAFFEKEMLVGFVNILEEDREVFIGIGVNPELCGRGYGRRILQHAYRISKERYPDKPLYLEVRTWNKRAVRCYQSAGFQIDGEAFEQTTGIGKGLFYRMIKA